MLYVLQDDNASASHTLLSRYDFLWSPFDLVMLDGLTSLLFFEEVINLIDSWIAVYQMKETSG